MAQLPYRSDDAGSYPSINEGSEEQRLSRGEPIDVQLDRLRRASLECLLSGNFGDARVFATAALLVLAAIPDGMIGGIASQTWNKSAINQFLSQLDRLDAIQAANDGGGGMVLHNYSYSGRRSC